MENPIKMDDLGVTPFLETPICGTKIQKNRERIPFFPREAGVNDGIKERRQEPPWG